MKEVFNLEEYDSHFKISIYFIIIYLILWKQVNPGLLNQCSKYLSIPKKCRRWFCASRVADYKGYTLILLSLYNDLSVFWRDLADVKFELCFRAIPEYSIGKWNTRVEFCAFPHASVGVISKRSSSFLKRFGGPKIRIVFQSTSGIFHWKVKYKSWILCISSCKRWCLSKTI